MVIADDSVIRKLANAHSLSKFKINTFCKSIELGRRLCHIICTMENIKIYNKLGDNIAVRWLTLNPQHAQHTDRWMYKHTA